MDIFIILGGEDEKKRPRSNYLVKLLKTSQYDWKTLKIICTGKANFDYYIHSKEAQRMKKFLIKNNIPHQSIITEEHALDTLGNMIFSYAIIEQLLQKTNSNEKIIIHLITDKFHITRSQFIFEKIFNTLKVNNPNIKFEFHKISEKNFIQRFISKPKQQIQEKALEELIILDMIQYNLQLPTEIENYLFSLPEYKPHYKGTMNLKTSLYAKAINKFLQIRDENSLIGKPIKSYFEEKQNE